MFECHCVSFSQMEAALRNGEATDLAVQLPISLTRIQTGEHEYTIM